MKIAIVDGPATPGRFDRVVPLESFARAPDASLTDDQLLLDEWATDIADAIRRSGQPLTIAEREAYRSWLVGRFWDELLGLWRPLTQFIEQDIRPNDELTLVSNRTLLRMVLAVTAQRRNIRFASRPLNVNRRLGARLLRGIQRRLLTRRDFAPSSCRPLVAFYLVCTVCPDIVRRTVRLLDKAGYQIVFVDMGREPVLINDLPYPVVRLKVGTAPAPAPLELKALPAVFDGQRMEMERVLNQYASPFIADHLAAHCNLWAHWPLRAVVMCEEGPHAACLALAAQKTGIVSVNVAHARTPPDHRCYGFSAVALFGQDIVDAQRRREEPPPGCSLRPVGACRYDDIFLGDYPDAAQVRQELCLPADQPIVCFASQWHYRNDHRGLKELALHWLIQSLPPEAVLVVKKHPLETDSICESALAGWDADRYRITRNTNLYGLLATSSVLVTLVSNAATEAVLLNKPVIMIEHPELAHELVPTYGLAVRPSNLSEFGVALQRCLDSSTAVIPYFARRRQLLVRNCLVADDGRSSERLAGLIQELLRR